MKRIFLFLLASIFLFSLHAQRFEFGLGFGLGSVNSSNKGFSEPAKGLIFLEARYRLNEHFGIGLEWGGAGNINPFDFLDEKINGNQEFSPNDVSASILLGKFLYYPSVQKKIYFALGAGIGKYSVNVNIQDFEPINRVSRLNFIFQPEIGLQFGGFTISYKYLAGGVSPSFTHTTVNGEFFSMKKANLGFSMLSFGYLFRI